MADCKKLFYKTEKVKVKFQSYYIVQANQGFPDSHCHNEVEVNYRCPIAVLSIITTCIGLARE